MELTQYEKTLIECALNAWYVESRDTIEPEMRADAANLIKKIKGNPRQYHKAVISESFGAFYALIIRVDTQGNEHVIRGYEGRHFKTRANAEKSTKKYMEKWGLK